MEKGNITWTNEFTLLGFSYSPQIKILLFVIILAVYMMNLIANSLFIVVTLVDSRLHSPMYFFLCNLSFLDICYSSVGGPTILKGFLVLRLTISYYECITQMYFGLSLGQAECFLLTVMAWDRYIAICKPLNYQQIMTNRVCVILAIATWTSGFIFALSSLILFTVVHFCGSNIIDHTLCESEALSRLICMDHNVTVFASSIVSLFTLVTPVSVILFSYTQIIATILRMPSAESRHRTFATCGSHLVVVTLFFGTAMVIYVGPKSTESSVKEKSNALFYGLVVPAINPLIYTLRNREVKGALRNVYFRKIKH